MPDTEDATVAEAEVPETDAQTDATAESVTDTTDESPTPAPVEEPTAE